METIKVAVEVLDILEQHTDETLHNLNNSLEKLLKQRKNNELWASAGQELRIEMYHPLHLAVLQTDAEIKSYIDQVSIFNIPSKRRQSSAGSRITTGENQEEDYLADFHKWMDNENVVNALLKGNIDLPLRSAKQYTHEYVSEKIKENSVLDILIKAGDEKLQSRIAEAANKARSMVSFSRDFASGLQESSLVSAYWETEIERGELQNAINIVFGRRPYTLVKSKDPTEIAIFYYADGFPMSAVTDLAGRCLEAFLKRRHSWYLQTKSVGKSTTEARDTTFNQRVGVPVYSGKDAQQRVEETGVIDLLYRVRGQNVSTYTKDDIPELYS